MLKLSPWQANDYSNVKVKEDNLGEKKVAIDQKKLTRRNRTKIK